MERRAINPGFFGFFSFSGGACSMLSLKGRVHGVAHAHESKCCFSACARCSDYASNIIS